MKTFNLFQSRWLLLFGYLLTQKGNGWQTTGLGLKVRAALPCGMPQLWLLTWCGHWGRNTQCGMNQHGTVAGELTGQWWDDQVNTLCGAPLVFLHKRPTSTPELTPLAPALCLIATHHLHTPFVLSYLQQPNRLQHLHQRTICEVSCL